MTQRRVGSSLISTRLLIAIVVGWYGVGTAFAEQDVMLSVTILIVDEKEACRPNGYRNYDDEASAIRQCERLDVAHVRSWIERDVLRDKIEIPPSQIPVGRLLPFLRSYVPIVTGTIDLARRRSVSRADQN